MMMESSSKFIQKPGVKAMEGKNAFTNVTILIVDDEPDIIEVLKDAFEDENFLVLTSPSGNHAKQILATQTVGIVLSDIRMKDGDGIDLLKHTRSLTPPIPKIFLMSGYTDYDNEEIKKMGAEDLIEKPFKLSELIDNLRQCIGLN